MVADGALRGAGDTKPSLFATIIGGWILAIPLAYLLAIPFDLGIWSIWFALVMGTGVSAFYLFIRWRNHRWIDVALHRTALYRIHLRRLPQNLQSRFLSNIRTPLMAGPETIEEIDEHGVQYSNSEGLLRVVFENDNYWVEENQGLLKTK
jgi:hypothetical protein